MEEQEFIELADAELEQIESALEAAAGKSAADWDVDLKPGGIIELTFSDGSKIIIHPHGAAREIWVAAKSGGFHFRPPSDGCPFWHDTRSGRSLLEILERCIGEQSGEVTRLGA